MAITLIVQQALRARCILERCSKCILERSASEEMLHIFDHAEILYDSLRARFTAEEALEYEEIVDRARRETILAKDVEAIGSKFGPN